MPATALLDVAICLLKHASRTNHGRDRKNRVFTRLLTLHKFNEQNTQAADASTCQNCIPAIQGMTPRKKEKLARHCSPDGPRPVQKERKRAEPGLVNCTSRTLQATYDIQTQLIAL